MSWIYITGRGHSGTTFLDIVLGNSQEVESFGEILSAVNRHESNCSCGANMKSCSVWGKIINDYNSQNNNSWITDFSLLQNYFHVKNWPRLFLTGSFGKENEKIKKINQDLFLLLFKTKRTNWILDSTKEPTRGLFLLSQNEDSRLIHMIRNPVGVANSYKKRFIKHGYFNFLRKKYKVRSMFWFFCLVIGISWVIGNILIELTSFKFKNRIIRVKHEDLIKNFPTTLKSLSFFLDANFEDLIKKYKEGQNFEVYHNIGGNGIKDKGGVTINTAVPTTNLTSFEKSIILVTTLPLRWKYGY